jgi:pimeloyl-ACP methyl ester carboxylesterase
MKVYFISGLAADTRVFRHIRLPEGFEPEFLDWIRPKPDESLQSYATRMAERIRTDEAFILVGLSFGGMLATEISSLCKPEKTILIASIPHPEHLPVYYRWLKRIRLQKVVPVSLVLNTVKLKRLFTNESPADKEAIRSMATNADPWFVRWAMNAVLEWKTDNLPRDYFHIHGSSDRILPVRYTRPTHVVSRGGHLMIMDRADEINLILQEILQS